MCKDCVNKIGPVEGAYFLSVLLVLQTLVPSLSPSTFDSSSSTSVSSSLTSSSSSLGRRSQALSANAPGGLVYDSPGFSLHSPLSSGRHIDVRDWNSSMHS